MEHCDEEVKTNGRHGKVPSGASQGVCGVDRSEKTDDEVAGCRESIDVRGAKQEGETDR